MRNRTYVRGPWGRGTHALRAAGMAIERAGAERAGFGIVVMAAKAEWVRRDTLNALAAHLTGVGVGLLMHGGEVRTGTSRPRRAVAATAIRLGTLVKVRALCRGDILAYNENEFQLTLNQIDRMRG